MTRRRSIEPREVYLEVYHQDDDVSHQFEDGDMLIAMSVASDPSAAPRVVRLFYPDVLALITERLAVEAEA
jgi:hypothetical protein